MQFFCQITKGSSRFWSFNDFWHQHFVGGFAKETETASDSSSRFFLSHFMGKSPLNYKIPEVSQCVQILTFGLTESNFQLSMMLLCTLTQGKIAVKSLSYLKHFRRRFSGKLQPKVHSLTRFAAWEISSISQKIRSYSFEKTRYFAARLEFFFPQS